MLMDSKQIEQLLEKYWSCETSLDEEQQLRDYFLREDIPLQWKEAAELFRYFQHQKKDQLTGPAFDEEIIRKVQGTAPAGKMVKMLYNYGRIAAGLLVVVAATYFVRQEIMKSYPPEVADTYTDPKLAFEETKRALMMIAKGFGKAQNETKKIIIFNEAEDKIQGKKPAKKEKVSI